MVSVIVPTYQRYHFLSFTARSILAQTHGNLELLIIADGHDPVVERLVTELHDERARYLFVEHSGLPGVPGNLGMRLAGGQFLAFCDDDDLWHPEKLRLQLELLIKGGWDMCATDYDYIDQDGREQPYRNYYGCYHGALERGKLYRSMGFVCVASVVIRREVCQQLGPMVEEPTIRGCEDFEYWVRLLSGHSGFMMKQRLVQYRLHGGSMQRGAPWKVLKLRMAAHRFTRQRNRVGLFDHIFKMAKLVAHFLLDCFPRVKQIFRRLQGRSGLPN